MVQGCLGNGVVLDAEGLLVLGEQGEDSCKRGEGSGQLVLQHVAVFLLQRAARELPLNEFHHWSEIRIWSSHPQDDGVAITEPDNGVFFFKFSEFFLLNSGQVLNVCVLSPPPVFEVLHAAQAAEPAVDHDGHSGTERFAFLHAAQKTEQRHVAVHDAQVKKEKLCLFSIQDIKFNQTCETSGRQSVPL